MQTKYLVQIVFIAAILVSNYLFVLEYHNEYVPDNFGIRKLLDQKYRCIRYFNEGTHSRYMDHKCMDYVYDYKHFTLEKSRYIYMFYMYNIIICNIFVLFHLLLN